MLEASRARLILEIVALPVPFGPHVNGLLVNDSTKSIFTCLLLVILIQLYPATVEQHRQNIITNSAPHHEFVALRFDIRYDERKRSVSSVCHPFHASPSLSSYAGLLRSSNVERGVSKEEPGNSTQRFKLYTAIKYWI